MNENTPKPDAEKSSTVVVDQDELVAYLDGELDSEGRRQVEQRLASDERYRLRLQQLQCAWDLLDELPRARASETFTRTTVEMVAVSAAEDLESRNHGSFAARRRARIGGAALLLAALLLGYWLVARSLDAPDRRLLTLLPVITNLDAYRHADSLDFLRQLQQAGLFAVAGSANSADSATESPGAEGTPGDADSLADSLESAPDDSLDDRRRRLAAASTSQIQEIQSSLERFERLKSEEQSHLEQLHHELVADPQAARLRQLLEQYFDWLKSLPSGRAAELRAMPASQRLTEIQRLLKDQEEQQFRRFVAKAPLPPEDMRIFFTWLDDWIGRNTAQLEAQLPAIGRERLLGSEELRKHRYLIYAFYLRVRAERGGDRSTSETLAPSPEDVAELEKKLSPESQRQLAKARATHDEARLIQEWTRATMFTKMLPNVGEEELSRFYREELTAQDRQRLDSMPRDQFQRELRKLFAEYKFRKGGLPRPFTKGGFGSPGGSPGGSFGGPFGTPFGEGGRGFKGDRPQERPSERPQDPPGERRPRDGDRKTDGAASASPNRR